MGYMWFSMYVRSFPVYPQQYKTHLFLLGSSDVFFFFSEGFKIPRRMFFASVVFSLLVDICTLVRHQDTP